MPFAAYADAITDGAADPMTAEERAAKQAYFSESFPSLASLLQQAHNTGARASA